MHWLGGVLESKGYSDLHVVDFYRDPTFLSEFATVDPSGDPPYFGSIRRMYTSFVL